MLSKKMEKLLNEQFVSELYAANQYLAISAWFLDQNLDGMANFFRAHSHEERMHGDKIFDYVNEAGGRLKLGAVKEPVNDFKDIRAAFDLAYGNEQKVTTNINKIVKVALDESDFATHAFLNWFVTEQVEEEDLFRNLIAKLDMIGDNSSALYLLDAELGKRPQTPEAG